MLGKEINNIPSGSVSNHTDPYPTETMISIRIPNDPEWGLGILKKEKIIQIRI